MKNKYRIIGRRGAGSMIAEFLFTEIGAPYDISFLQSGKEKIDDITSSHPLGRIPILICPTGKFIFETLAIINHITNRYECFTPPKNTKSHDTYWQILSLLATTVYPAYHRQHHSKYYTVESGYDDLRDFARSEQAVIYDYIETLLNPYICGELITAADFYLYMLSRWDVDKTALRKGRPKLTTFLEQIRSRPSVIKVLNNQKK